MQLLDHKGVGTGRTFRTPVWRLGGSVRNNPRPTRNGDRSGSSAPPAASRRTPEASISKLEDKAQGPVETARDILRFFQSIDDLLLVATPDGRVLFSNAAIQRKLGFSAEDLSRMHVLDVHPEGMRRKAAEFFAAMFRDERESCPLPFATKAGTLVPVETRVWRGRWGGVDCIYGLSRDLSAEREAQQRFEALFRRNPSIMALTALPDRCLYDVNDAFLTTLGFTRAEVIGKPGDALDLFPDAPKQHHLETLLELGECCRDVELQVRRKDGAILQCLFSGERISIQGQEYLLTVLVDITERKRMEARLQQIRQAQAQARIDFLAYHDPLTGVPNRVLGQDRLLQAIGLADRHRTALAVLHLDLDKFKYFNDTYGHALSDALLKQLAERLNMRLGQADTLCRLGGDEFMLVLGELIPEQVMGQVATICADLLERVADPFEIDGRQLHASLSIGVAIYPQDGVDAGVLMRHANTALAEAKSASQHSYRFFEPQMNLALRRFVETRDALRIGLEQAEFELYYQPQIDLLSGRVVGAEALLRWRRAGQRLVPPDDFIQVAEESGLIASIGRWVLQEACRQAAIWHASGWPHLSVAVNLSAAQFRQADIEQDVAAALDASGLDPRCLELELTESLFMQEVESISEMLMGWKARGIQLAIDDFGTGYSSLAYLKRFQVNRLKIDRSFIADILHDEQDRAIVQGVIQIARGLGLQTLSEGVETSRQAAQLRRMGCDMAQGYLYAKPLSAPQFASWLRHRAGRSTAGPSRDGPPSVVSTFGGQPSDQTARMQA
ncbi:putative bifunctional diguanylate cyclase/phosphodiesterase [Thiohalocapsa marina]|uniref:putative bifunctional diguanylate cyclase/phosphodiesterase n=1 Tax=Thiohalocapsa marina TaxID=424902 RepID=UPI0036D9FA58